VAASKEPITSRATLRSRKKQDQKIAQKMRIANAPAIMVILSLRLNQHHIAT
jgi:hypothetical protein